MTLASLAEPIAATLEAVAVLEKLGIRYAVGGSMASSFHGHPRMTDDVDLVAAIGLAQAVDLERMWNPTFYADATMIRDAIQDQSSFNIIHNTRIVKIDVFVPGRDDFAVEELARARAHVVGTAGETLVVATAEDVVLQKLRWYRLGGETSERQWRDVVGVLEVGRTRVDVGYLERWAPKLGVADLLTRVLVETARARATG